MMRGPILAAALPLALTSAAAWAARDGTCGACLPAITAPAEARPLRIEIESGIEIGRLALRGRDDGEAEIDPQTGTKRLVNMIDLGGLSWQGRARVFGEPLRPVRIELPPNVVLRSADGAEAVLSDFSTDLPPVAMLDENGQLEFGFGARLSSQGARGGNFRGRIRIEVDYY